MADGNANDVTIISVGNMIYQTISEIRYSFSKCPNEYRTLNFIKGFLDGNGIGKTIFWQKLKILEKEGKTINKPSKKGNSFLLPIGNLNSSFIINDRSVRKFLGSIPHCSQDFCHILSLIREEMDSLNEIINQSIQSLRQDNPNEYVSIKTQTCNELSADYVDITVGSNDELSVTVAHKSTWTESECYQLVG